MDIQKILEGLGFSGESLERVRLGRGVVGKTTYVALGALALLSIVAWRLNDPQLLLVIAGVGALLFLIYFIGILVFANRNPATALLEGAELLRWRQYDLAAKGLPNPPPTPAIVDPLTPRQELTAAIERPEE
ncbi:MAG: hypothetical protein HY726_08125 [Candidatus Rokubacteria bacterium]|nr:hypothetical protein [Candidatus Rokubacteria bacterium]